LTLLQELLYEPVNPHVRSNTSSIANWGPDFAIANYVV